MLNKLKVDAIIAADGGVIDVIKEEAPDVPIHVSTQANTVSYHTANFWYKNGAKRVILGRETKQRTNKRYNKKQRERLRSRNFYSWCNLLWIFRKMLLSDFLVNRSANLGDCAQSCRWAYNVYVEEHNNPGNLMPVEHDEKVHIYFHLKICV